MDNPYGDVNQYVQNQEFSVWYGGIGPALAPLLGSGLLIYFTILFWKRDKIVSLFLGFMSAIMVYRLYIETMIYLKWGL